MTILLIAAASAVGVLLHQRWDWLSFGVFLITVPQWVAWLAEGQTSLAIVAILSGFGVLGAAAAVGYELRAAARALRPSSSFLLALNALVLGAAGWIALSAAGQETVGDLWLASLAAVHLAIGLAATRSRLTAHAFGLLSLAIGAVLADIAFAALVEGPLRALGWAGAGVALAALRRQPKLRPCDETLTTLGLGAHVALALLQALTIDAPPALIGSGDPLGLGAVVSLAGAAAGCLVSARLAHAGRPELRIALDATGLAVAVYLTALTLDGAPLTIAWSVEAVALARLGSRMDDEPAAWAGRAYLALATAHALAIVAPLMAVIEGSPEPLAAIAALGAVSAAAAACAHLARRERQEIHGALESIAIGAPAYLAAVTLDGAALVAALAIGAVALGELARRSVGELTGVGALALLGGALVHVLVFEAPPTALVEGVEHPLAAAISLGAVVLAAITCGRPGSEPAAARRWVIGAAALAGLYLASVLVVTPFGGPDGSGTGESLPRVGARQQGQVLLSVLWSLAGFAALVAGLRRDLPLVRTGALALLLVTVGKVFLFDLATLTSVYRVASFIGLGLFLLTAAFVWQRLRPRPLPDVREVPVGVR